MNPADLPHNDTATLSQEELLSALFANLVVQQTNMALMFLGKVPHPQTGEALQDIDSAKMLIDQLEMLAVKTKGNLNKHEDSLLKQSLTTLRMSFVEAVDNPTRDSAPTPDSKTSAAAQPHPQPSSQSRPAASSPASSSTDDEEPRKKFSKRY